MEDFGFQTRAETHTHTARIHTPISWILTSFQPFHDDGGGGGGGGGGRESSGHIRTREFRVTSGRVKDQGHLRTRDKERERESLGSP